MIPLIIALLVDPSVTPPTFVYDEDAVCADVAPRFHEILVRHQVEFPSGSYIEVELRGNSSDQTIALTLFVDAPGNAVAREVHKVNTCLEALDLLEFLLSVGQTLSPSPTDLSPPSGTADDIEDEGEGEAAKRRVLTPSRVNIGGFSLASTNYPEAVGLGVGGGMTLGFDVVALEGYGVWMEPLQIVSEDRNVADYTFSRFDLGVLSSWSFLFSGLHLAPAVGLSFTRLQVSESQVAPGADHSAHTWLVDAGLKTSKTLFARTALDAALLVRYGIQEFDFGKLDVGNFTPGRFEVNLRLGLSFDVLVDDRDKEQTIATRARCAKGMPCR